MLDPLKHGRAASANAQEQDLLTMKMCTALQAIWMAVVVVCHCSPGLVDAKCVIAGNLANPTDAEALDVGKNCYSSCPQPKQKLTDSNTAKVTKVNEVELANKKNLTDDNLKLCGHAALKSQYEKNKGQPDNSGPGCPINLDSIANLMYGMCCSACSPECKPGTGSDPTQRFWYNLGGGAAILIVGLIIMGLKERGNAGEGSIITRCQDFFDLACLLGGDVAVVATLMTPPDCLNGLEKACEISILCCEPRNSFYFKQVVAVATIAKSLFLTVAGLVLHVISGANSSFLPESYSNKLYGIFVGKPIPKDIPGGDEKDFKWYSKIHLCATATVTCWGVGITVYDGWKGMYASTCADNLLAIAGHAWLVWFAVVAKGGTLCTYWILFWAAFFDFWTLPFRGCALTSKSDSIFGKVYKWCYFAGGDNYLTYWGCRTLSKYEKQKEEVSAREGDARSNSPGRGGERLWCGLTR
eukprot:SAG25_NODE_198_length_12124_cov_20.420208_1_plen_469_part_00